jgi:hypothetical protein
MAEHILVIAPLVHEADEFVSTQLGVQSGHLSLVTKYYSASVPVKTISEADAPDQLGADTGAIILVQTSPSLLVRFARTNTADETVRLFIHTDFLDECIDSGFEQVTDGVDRVIEALKCRVWSDENPTPDLSELETLDTLMSRMKMCRDLSDSDRRIQAEIMITKLMELIGSDSEDSET